MKKNRKFALGFIIRLFFVLLSIQLILIIPQKQGGIYFSSDITKPHHSISEATYKVMIERIYVVDEKDNDDQAPGDAYLNVFKDGTFLQSFGAPDGDFKIKPNSYKQMNLDIFTSSFTGIVPSINITVQARESDSGSSEELGIVEYIIPSLSEGEFHRFEGESSDQNIKFWFLTTYGAEPQYGKFSSSFVLNNIQILDDTDSTNKGDIRIEVLFNGLPVDAQFYPTTDPYQWQIESGDYFFFYQSRLHYNYPRYKWKS